MLLNYTEKQISLIIFNFASVLNFFYHLKLFCMNLMICITLLENCGWSFKTQTFTNKTDQLTLCPTDWHDAQLTDMMMPIYPPPSLTSIVESIIIMSRSHLLYLHSSNQSQIITPVQGIYRRFKFKPSFVDKIDFSHNFIFYLSCVDF